LRRVWSYTIFVLTEVYPRKSDLPNNPGIVNPSHRPHINNNGGPSCLLTDDDADSEFYFSDMKFLRSFITQQMKDLEMIRPALVIERQRAQRAQEERNISH